MKRKDFDSLIDRGAFRELFVTEMGWNNPDNSQPLYITIDEQDFDFIPVADKQGFHVYSCEMDILPTAAECKKIDNKLRNYGYDYICIFVQTGTVHHLWLTPVKTNEKRELVKTEYIGGAKADFLFSKIDDLTFELTERVLITDVKNRVHGSFHLNSEKVTKDFYAQFRKEHTAFKKHITGIDDDKNKDWYASVMLNRLMFCYFIQKKGFLDMNANYLQDKLRWMQGLGRNQFFGSFYKGFLCSLFHDGLNSPRHDEDFLQKYGHIPYLNGGMFDDHQLEREHTGIDIADEAFVNLFNFFDKWNWHLDTRLTASGKDINPDVLGYIFEQYINDRAAMGAYYTKEDITEYIGKNCIIPFLMDKTASATKDSAKAFAPGGFVWQLLRESGDKYIYDAVKKGHSADWQQRIPDYIYKGIDTTVPDLLERRGRWNERTYEEFSLPTEIWRETIERLQRCDSLLQKINGGEINSINDFITYNLDIRQFTEDVIRQTEDHNFVAHFYHALQNVTILDPTCGSGAFLFAALNILEPLYEACLDRMEEWHQQNSNLFVRELEEINAKYSSNRQYFIYKSIILRNLYGVDIMVEATEIAKLRLFLKMVAVVEVDKRKDNLGLDPLPDIDFNIKCGNTLVGYATEQELDKALAYGDMFANQEFKEKINTEMAVVAKAYECFRSEQLKTYDDNASIKETKEMLKERLTTLNGLLNQHMHQSATGGGDYNKWLKNTQPFHWLAEFYQIIKGNGGFDVIIGNPPYVEHSSNDFNYSLSHFVSAECGNLYGNCIERGLSIGSKKGKFSFIIPVAITCSKRMDKVIAMLKRESSTLLFANFDDRPGKLFEMIEHLRATIFIASRSKKENNPEIFATKYNRWYTEHRGLLFNNLSYVPVGEFVDSFIIPKFSYNVECSVNRKLQSCKSTIAATYTKIGNNKVYYRAAGGGYFLLIKNQKSITYINGKLEDVKAEKSVIIDKEYSNTAIGALLSSSLFYWNYIGYTDCRNLTKSFIDNFNFVKSIGKDTMLIKSGDKLFENYEATKYTKNTTYKSTGRNVIYDEYYPKLSKQHIDEIDKVLAKHYGFTEEELDFIINYDVKYRMGDELMEQREDS
ncbi:MAG: SAM-dependent methyltransferase [Bacteroidales bacterium]|nr:SAM-dependent methyltransferase [Bacteroidales bacterium]